MIWKWHVLSAYPRADQGILEAFQKGWGLSEKPIPQCTRNQLKKLFDRKCIRTHEKILKPSHTLCSEMVVCIDFPEIEVLECQAEERDLDFLYQDEHLAVLNKPQGLTVHPSSTQKTGTLVHALLYHLKDLSGVGGVLRPGIVHRLDQHTSGALVVAKTDVAHQKLSEAFARHAIERIYIALCYGSPDWEIQKVESLLGRNPLDRKKMSMDVRQGKLAISEVKRLASYGQPAFASYLQVKLKTGRTHQVRVHLTGLGYSILGDSVYGSPRLNQKKWLSLPDEVQRLVKQLPGQALHAKILGFEHPVTGQKLRFQADPPPLFRNLLEVLQS